MTTTTSMTAAERDAMKRLSRYVERQIARNEGIIKESMENLTRDFNETFEWESERIFKCNLKLEFFNEVRKLLADEECTIEAARYYLRHEAEHAADDIMHRDPYRSSSNAAANLAHRWTYESYKDIYHLALNALDNLNPDEE